MNHAAKIIRVGLLTMLLLTGCATQWVYNRLDWLLATYLEYTLVLDSRQSAQLYRALPVALSTHRRQHLPRYHAWLLRLRGDIAQGITAPQLDDHYQTLQSYWQDAIKLLAEPIAAAIQTADDTQVEHFLSQLHDSSLANAKAQERPVRRIKRQLKPWLGGFSPAQNQLFTQWNSQFNALHEFYVRSDTQWQAALRTQLQQRNSPYFVEQFSFMLAHPDSALTQTQRGELAASESLAKALLLELAQSLTSEQREYLLAQLQLWADDFAALASQTS
jgi:hypothetical protein